MTLREQLLDLFDTYAEARGLSRSRISTIVFSGGHVIERLEKGGDVTTGNFEKAVRWFSANWPEGTPWPQGIARPEATPQAAA